MDQPLPILLLFVGLAIGAAAAWLVLRAKIQHAYDRGQAEGQSDQMVLTERLAARQETIDD